MYNIYFILKCHVTEILHCSCRLTPNYVLFILLKKVDTCFWENTVPLGIVTIYDLIKTKMKTSNREDPLSEYRA